MDRQMQRAYDLEGQQWVFVISRGYAMSHIVFSPGVSIYVSNDDLIFEEEDEE